MQFAALPDAVHVDLGGVDERLGDHVDVRLSWERLQGAVVILGRADGLSAQRARADGRFDDERLPQFLGEFRVGRDPGRITSPRAPDVRREPTLLQVLVPEEENSLGIEVSRRIQLPTQIGRGVDSGIMNTDNADQVVETGGGHRRENFLHILHVRDVAILIPTL
ncbi:hypothetical protein ACIOHC_38175 [Streptomyces sp. NPDC088252]|uniref:hypothetical protein n=1 Tax=unclassified Streptomyces TaxID=2593676 RepID=UPI003416AF82